MGSRNGSANGVEGSSVAKEVGVQHAPSASSLPHGSTPRLLEQYHQQIMPALMKQFGYPNRLAVPRLAKIVVNMGCGEAAHDDKVLEEAQRDLSLITGQRPMVTRARKAVSNFKIQEGNPVGCKVTLRRKRMYEFLDRLINATLPRIRDFRGLSNKGFDHAGNYTFGVQEQLIFPELDPDDVHYTLGMDITLVITTKTPEPAKVLLALFGLPFQKG